jgi:hypothetical protein
VQLQHVQQGQAGKKDESSDCVSSSSRATFGSVNSIGKTDAFALLMAGARRSSQSKQQLPQPQLPSPAKPLNALSVLMAGARKYASASSLASAVGSGMAAAAAGAWNLVAANNGSGGGSKVRGRGGGTGRGRGRGRGSSNWSSMNSKRNWMDCPLAKRVPVCAMR